MTIQEQKFAIMILKVLHKEEMISDVVVGNVAKRITDLEDAKASSV